jgi:hypothetical protein
MNRHEAAHERVEEEIRREKAAVLGRAGERLDAVLADAWAMVRRFEAVSDPRERERVVREYEPVRRRAEAARLALVIQREAIGLRSHAVLDRLFPEPPRRLPGR